MSNAELQSKIDFIDEIHRDILAVKTKVKGRGYPEELLLADFSSTFRLMDRAKKAFLQELARRGAKAEKERLLDLTNGTKTNPPAK